MITFNTGKTASLRFGDSDGYQLSEVLADKHDTADMTNQMVNYFW